MKLTLLALIAQSYLNDFYIYGANGVHIENGITYKAWDCSSYVLQVLKETEFIKDNVDRSAQMLHDHLIGREDIAILGGRGPDSVLFFGESTKEISHVALALDHTYMIGASSGDRTTLSIAEAVKRNAKVKLSRIKYRDDLVASIILSK